MMSAALQRTIQRCRAVVGMETEEDLRCLFRFAKLLHRTDRNLPDLQKLAKAGEIMCTPFGLDPRGIIELFLTFEMPQLYLFGRDSSLRPDERRALIRRIRQDGDASALVLRKRALTNYLHADAILEECHVRVAVTDDSDVPLEVVRHVLRHSQLPAWDQLDPQLRTDLAAAMAMELKINVARRMTASRLAQRDPAGEVAGWLRTVGSYLNRP